MFKNCAPFASCVTEINDTKVGNAKDIDRVMPMYNLREHVNAYSKTLESLWKYYRDEPALDNNDNIVNFPDNCNNSNSFKLKQ